ncbi:MAG: hypothetical protein GWN01_03605 [Nitrosopumilaceae archaeon]|nr:hypothetical protein [Nitrosopumilaceae archaeon]NIU00044.1 hypothetical protein [Nitrosopumilaceae archaeon]NIU86423.1 hypothetical protein [Nitrosopumilaceae archaeon]NIV65132.1 hypothetical protein [Nitrosopumilaceae archaeon]NIX60646.1 hypothetical protein [Nitrosopumilaceae archaeon]
MKIGNNEKILAILIRTYPNISDNKLRLLFQYVTGKNIKLKRTLVSLRNKRLVYKNSNRLYPDVSDKLKLGNAKTLVSLAKELGNSNQVLEKNLRLGKKEKAVLYILSKINQSSLQFLATCTVQKTENIFPVLKRLEENELIHSYTSPIRHRNANGRWYRPKHYKITEMGKIISKKIDRYDLDQKIDDILTKATTEAQELRAGLHGILNIK